MIEMHDIDKVDEGALKGETVDPLAGFLYVLPNGAWIACRVSTRYERSGDGSLRDLEPGLWITNLPWERVSALSADLRHVALRSDGWLKLSADQILAISGMDDAAPPVMARYLALITHRIHTLTLDAMRRYNPDPRANARLRNALRTKASLATAIHVIHDGEINRGRPEEKRIAQIFRDSYQLGMFFPGRKVVPEGHVNLAFRLPALGHALLMARQPVPDMATWQIGVRGQDASSASFVEQARRMQRPLIFRASCSAMDGRGEAIDAMVGASRHASTYRTLFLPEEIDLLMKRVEMSVEAVVGGGGWRPTCTGKLLDAMIETCGGVVVASHALSAHILAENILASAFRFSQAASDVPPAEGIWLAARDRCRMFPAIEAFYDFGASLVTAHYGCITMQCPADPELLAGCLDTAWQFGLILPITDIRRLAAMGVPIPFDRSEFGGNPVDYGFSLIAQRAKKKALLALDDVMDAPMGERSERFKAILS